jgi:hypothetical protein
MRITNLFQSSLRNWNQHDYSLKCEMLSDKFGKVDFLHGLEMVIEDQKHGLIYLV